MKVLCKGAIFVSGALIILGGCQDNSEGNTVHRTLANQDNLNLPTLVSSEVRNVQDYEKARLCFEKEQHPREGLRLMLQAAQAGYSPAQLYVAKMYHNGQWVEENPYLAFQWYSHCATKEPEAAFQVGVSYLLGDLGQEKDVQKGLHYLGWASSKNYAPAKVIIQKLTVLSKQNVTQRKSNLKSLKALAQQGSPQAQFDLAKQLMEYTQPEYDKLALYWMTKSALGNHLEAKYWLGVFFQEGIGTPVDYNKAYVFFRELASQDHALAQYRLGKILYEGVGFEKDVYEGRKWLLRAAEQGVEEAKVMNALIAMEPVDIVQVSENDDEDAIEMDPIDP